MSDAGGALPGTSPARAAPTTSVLSRAANLASTLFSKAVSLFLRLVILLSRVVKAKIMTATSAALSSAGMRLWLTVVQPALPVLRGGAAASASSIALERADSTWARIA